MADDLADALAPLLEAVGAEVIAAPDAGPADIEVTLGEQSLWIRPPKLDGALGRLIEGVERDLGAPLQELSREQKQAAVGLLNSRGAFNLRKSVEDIAAALGVSRFTVYNYLDRVSDPA